MLNAYVGIVSVHGLKAIHVEQVETMRHVRRLATMTDKCVGFWAVIPDSEFQVVRFLLGVGEEDSALHYLNLAARDIGRILPLHQ